MTTTWLTTMKPTFTNEWLAISAKEAHQVSTFWIILCYNDLVEYLF